MLGGVGACLGTGLAAPVLREGFEKGGSSEKARGQREEEVIRVRHAMQMPKAHPSAGNGTRGGAAFLPPPSASRSCSYHFACGLWALGVGEGGR